MGGICSVVSDRQLLARRDHGNGKGNHRTDLCTYEKKGKPAHAAGRRQQDTADGRLKVSHDKTTSGSSSISLRQTAGEKLNKCGGCSRSHQQQRGRLRKSSEDSVRTLCAAGSFNLMSPLEMPMHEHRPPPKEQAAHPAEDVRQGSIILRKPWQKALFAVGLVGGVLWAIAMALFFETTP